MHVLMLRPQCELGGVSNHLVLLVSGLRQRGHNVMMATTGGSMAPRVAAAGASLLIVPELYPSRLSGMLRAVLRLSVLVRVSTVEVLHSHHRFTTVVGGFVARLTGRPLVVTVHEFKTNWARLASFWTSDSVIVPSNALRDHLVSFHNIPAGQITVVPNAIALPETPMPWSRAGRRPPMIGYIGRLSEEKGARYFVESLPLIRQAVPDLQAIVVGDGSEHGLIRSLAQKLGLDPDKLLLGSRDDVLALMSKLDLVVVPSVAESFSLVALEAMHLGLPVVATRVGGLVDLVRDGETGRLVEPRNPVALATAVIELLGDPALMAVMGARGRQVAVRDYSPDAMVERTVNVYSRVLVGVSQYTRA